MALRTSLIVDIVTTANLSVLNKVGQALKGMSLESIRSQQAMQGLNTRMKALSDGMKPLAEQTRTAMIDGFVKPSSTAEQAANGIIDKQKEMTQFSKQFEKQMNSEGAVMLRTQNQMRTFGGVMQILKSRMMSFRMEMLGVMFFGMAMSRMFSGLLRPAMDVFGVFDLFQSMLQILFIPIMELLFPLFLKVFDFFTTLPEPVQIMIGVFTLMGAIIGKILFVFGTLVLGISSFIQMIGGTSVVIPLINAIKLVFVGFGSTILFIAGLAAVLFALWQTNLGGFRDFVKSTLGVVYNTFVGIFTDVFNFVSSIWKALTSALSGDWDTAWESLKSALSAVGSFFARIWFGAIAIIKNAFIFMANAISQIFFDLIVNGILEVVQRMLDAIISKFGLFGGALEKISNKFDEIQDKISGFRKSIAIDFVTAEDVQAQTAAALGASNNNKVVNITNTTNVNVLDVPELERTLDERDKSLAEKVYSVAPS